MYRQLWKDCYASVCSLNFYNADGINFISFTGFKAEGYLMTDELIFHIKGAKTVVIRFCSVDGCEISAKIKFTMKEFMALLKPGIEKENHTFAIFKIDQEAFNKIPSLPLVNEAETFPEVGISIAILGYQLNFKNLSIKPGILSSYIIQEGTRYIQIETSIKQGNSGSPVVNLETGKVIGIVGHRLAQITKTYEEMKEVFKKNLTTLSAVEGKINFDGIDPVQVLLANQNQIKHIAKELYKSANMRVGFATHISHVFPYLQD